MCNCPNFRYDRHREQILHGSQSYADESLDVFQYFSASCYRGYDDSAAAFYAVYREVFEKLAAEDYDFMDSEDESDIPSFGNAKSDYDEVVGPFYAYWQSYCTKKSYSWLCQHNLTEIRDRRLLRHVEKDLKKITAKAKKERNDEVRALVAFVKKRDRRVIEHRRVLEERAEANRAKQTEKRMEQLRKNRLEVEEAMKQQKVIGVGGDMNGDYEKQLKRMERAYGSDSYSEEESEDDEDLDEVRDKYENGTEELDEEEEYVDHLYCVACNKSFKNVSSMRNHESSKKHRDNLDRIRMEMFADEEANAEVNGVSDSEDEIEDKDEDEDEDVDSNVNKASPDEEIHLNHTTKLGPQSKKARRKAQKLAATDKISKGPVLVENASLTVQNEDEEQISTNKTTKKSRRRAKQNSIPPNTIVSNKSQATKSNGSKLDEHDGHASDSSNDGLDRWTDRKEKRANAKKAKATKPKIPQVEDIDLIDVDHTCVTCAAIFESKNKLFSHLKSANHGVYIEGKGVTMSREVLEAAQAAASASGKGKKSRRKV